LKKTEKLCIDNGPKYTQSPLARSEPERVVFFV